MIVNLDSILAPDWSADLGSRGFEYEAFLSHNRNDHSDELALKLNEHGARVWHDGNADLRDRRVRQKVAQALRASRFVVVFIDSQFRDSEWCKAEYVPALAAEKAAQSVRVLVALTSPPSCVPESLEHCPKFTIDEVAKLARYLIDVNSLHFSPETVSSNAPIISRQDLGPLFEKTQITDDLSTRIARRLRSSFKDILAEAGSTEFSQELFLMRNVWGERGATVPTAKSLEGRLIRAVCLNTSLSPNVDNRANSLMLLAALDEQYRTPKSLSEVLKFLRREQNENVISTISWWFKDINSRLTPEQMEIVELTALRSPKTFRQEEGRALIHLFSDCVRSRVMVGPGLGEGLSSAERLTLLEGRLDYILSQPGTPGFVDTLGAAGALLGVTETEVALRELCSEVLEFRAGDNALAPALIGRVDLLVRAVECFARVLQTAKEHDGWPMLGWEEWALDFIIKPLGVIFGAGVLRVEVEEAICTACDVLEKSSKVSDEVPCYRTYLAHLLDGRSPEDAGEDLTLCIMRQS